MSFFKNSCACSDDEKSRTFKSSVQARMPLNDLKNAFVIYFPPLNVSHLIQWPFRPKSPSITIN
ncbi:hypothetical protein BpHYR1_004234 [Brachionus plicatilis]|uniref:Uncharacterized protein n=1 Tax=Brachionus plicatilis TaxID=10195 RepID=A0A3M7QB92_BRAPC|nr:hypothetical protein BpHYR1_004234 [Brachionus plicatilis]